MLSRKFPVGIPIVIKEKIPVAIKEGQKGFVKVQIDIYYIGKHYPFIGAEPEQGEVLVYQKEVKGIFW
jgi:cell division septal protein FtsQ